MKAARVENEVITNIAVFADDATLPPLWVPFQTGMEIGGGFDGTTITPAPPKDDEVPVEEKEKKAQATAERVQLQKSLADDLEADTLSDEEFADIVFLYPEWTFPKAYTLGQIVRYDDNLWKVVQAHNSQADWTPDVVPALFTPFRNTSGSSPDAWVQPTGAQDAYAVGDRVVHDNPNEGGALWVYESSIAANTTEPGRDGTFDRYWTPIEAA